MVSISILIIILLIFILKYWYWYFLFQKCTEYWHFQYFSACQYQYFQKSRNDCVIQYIFSKFPFLNNCNHKLSTCVSSSYHELIQNAFSNHILYNKHNHKLSTNMTFCSYELISYFQASFLRKTKITNWALKWLFVVMNCYNMHF